MEDDEIDKIKACPFCGGDAAFKKYYKYDGYQGESATYRVKCENCGAEIEKGDKKEAITSWNRRSKDDQR